MKLRSQAPFSSGFYCVHQYIEQQAARSPHTPAVRFEEESLSYADLDARANRLARALRTCGVGPEKLVAIFLERSLDLAVALVGVLKAGGAYVPLDVEQQNRRQAFILENCQPRVIVTQRKLKSQLPAHSAAVLYVDNFITDSSGDDVENMDCTAQAHNLAYVLYTSGSTGTPKGVAVEHRQLMAYLLEITDRLGFEAGSSHAMVQPLTVDSSITALYPPLILGGTVHIISRDRSLDPDQLREYFQRSPVDHLKIAPSHLEALLHGFESRDLLPDKCLVIGGESSSWELIDKIGELEPQCAVVNHYGPTETTVGVTTCRLDTHGNSRSTASPPIGQPLARTRVYILNEHRQQVPAGTVGELFVGGDQVARGYWRQPELTSRSFIPDPFSATPDARLYRTGDLVRCLSDGSLEFVGRADRQIKVRGYRVEPAEIENVLAGHPAVRQATIGSYEDMAGRKRLVAYVVPEPDRSPTTYHLQRYLGQHLPPPMVPASFVFLNALPLSTHGKIDRNALPPPQTQRIRPKESLASPQTSMETVLLEIWHDVLGIAPIGVNESFFDLGGDSLMAVTLLTRVRQVFARDMSVYTLFNAPTVEGMAKALGSYGKHAEELSPVIPVPRNQDFPLSCAQQRIWFILHTNPDSVAYSYATKLYFEGDLNVQALEKSLTEVVRRHEIYRTSFHDSPTGPLQRVHPPGPARLSVVDLSTFPQTARQAEANRQTDAFIKRPFDVGRVPLVRWILLRLDAHTHQLIHVESHLLHDGWSADQFVQELIDLYNAFSSGKASPLTDLPIQYGDFVHWERAWIRSPAAERQREFWKRALDGCQPHLQLPVDRSRPVWQTFTGRRHVVTLNEAPWRRLCDLARLEHSTPFVVMLAAFYVLLSCYTGQTDLNVGTGVANRRRPEVKNVLGMFINNLVLRMDVSENSSFRVLLLRVREVVLKALAHQELPFDQVVDMLAEERDMSRNPLYQAMFSFHDTPVPDLSVRNMRITREPTLSIGTSKFDLGVIVYPATTRIAERGVPGNHNATWMIWEYSSELFDSDTIERMAHHYQNLLNQVVNNPDLTLSELSPLTPPEHKRLLEQWQQTETDCPGTECVHAQFESQVSRAPDALALVFDDGSLTYAELNTRANQLAHYLRGAGVGPGIPVGLFVDRSPHMVTGMMGILKAGGVYVPLDPEHPKDRLAFMLADAGIHVVLTREALTCRLPDLHGQIVCMDKDWHTIGLQSSENLIDGLTPEDLAYVIYTSGSTGQPKGVAVPHSAIGRNCRIMADCYRIRPDDRVLQFSRISFDQSMDQILLPLSCGAQVVLPGEDILDPERFTATLSRHKVTFANLSPAYWRKWMQALSQEETHTHPGKLRLISIGGDVMLPDDIRMWNDLRISQCVELMNAYGPTEATITTTVYRVSRNHDSGVVPIGRPLPGCSVYILDRFLRPVPTGVSGELHIGGATLAQGYINRPQLTSEKFIRHPFSDDPAARLYKTGDLARYRSDGIIEYLGRTDHQIKIRGYRIELGEVEAVLSLHPAVREAVVNVYETNTNDKRLVAYVGTGSEPFTTDSELRGFLRKKLPEYMVPSAFVRLESLPLTSSGKVDRGALPAPDSDRPRLEQELVPPRTPTEKAIADVWAEVLGIESVGIHDDFFDLGGHSIIAMQVVSRIGQVCPVDLGIRVLFDTPTVAELAQYVDASEAPH